MSLHSCLENFTHLYPTLVPLPPRAPFMLLFRLSALLLRTTAAVVAFSSFRAGPHQGLRRNAARTALELFPGMTTYWGAHHKGMGNNISIHVLYI